MSDLAKEQINPQCGAALARLFSSSVIREFAQKGRSTLAARILDECRFLSTLDLTMSLRDFFESLFSLLFSNYRNEYIYKNALANQILLGRHSLDTSFMLTEFRAGDCKADVVILNGTSNVYEIKSEFDNTDRLQRQIRAYSLLFDYVHVVTSDEQIKRVLREVDETVGLMVLNDNETIDTVRAPQSIKHSVQQDAIFDSLRRREYVNIILNEFGYVPEVPNTRIYTECKELFRRLLPETAHDAMVSALRARGNCRSVRDFIAGVPPSLKASSLSCKLSNREQTAFLNLLNTDIRRCFATT